MQLARGWMRSTVAIGIVVLASAIGAGPAAASEVRVVGDNYGNRTVQYVADPGEGNDLRVGGKALNGDAAVPFCLPTPNGGYCGSIPVSYPAQAQVTFSDPGATIRSGYGGCVSRDAHEMTCVGTTERRLGVYVSAGDLTDSVSLDIPAAVNAGSGSDRIAGSPSRDSINVQDGEPDTVDCGGGEDSSAADSGDALTACEWVTYPTTTKPGGKKR